MKIFPNSFSLEIYRKNNSDLQELSEEQLKTHYYDKGIKEGRIANEITNKHQLVNYIKTLRLNKILEIGAFDRPLIDNIKHFDISDQKTLKIRASIIKRNPDNIPFIHYVNSEGSLCEIDEKFDIILSSHCIEHQVDFIKHLNEIENILINGGFM